MLPGSAEGRPSLTPISSSVLLLAAVEKFSEGEEDIAHGDEQEHCFSSEDPPQGMLYFQKQYYKIVSDVIVLDDSF